MDHMPSLEFNSVELLHVAHLASERAIVDFHSRRAALTLDSLVAAVFAAASVEAFTNDLADHVDVWRSAAECHDPRADSRSAGSHGDRRRETA
jgi:hypothetical protein